MKISDRMVEKIIDDDEEVKGEDYEGGDSDEE